MKAQPLISYDYSNMLSAAVGGAGVSRGRFTEIAQELEKTRRKILDDKRSGKIGFFDFLTAPDARLAAALAKEVSKKFSTLIVVGIGGSDLGARAILKALSDGRGMDVRFIGANTDPEEIADLLAAADLKRSAINIISKSGDTIEPMSVFLLLRDRLIKKVGAKKHASHIIATTDAKSGTLRQIAVREGYRTLPVPERVGGRFSALTTVGLFPAACAGISPSKLLSGAKAVFERFVGSPPSENEALVCAGLHHDAYMKGRRVHVLMPYSEKLREFAFWHRQLIAESLGKKKNRSGQTVSVGPTPVAALGATDQHSQLQLYAEGPDDKVITFIEIDSFRADFAVPRAYPDIEGVFYMGGHDFSRIIHAEREAAALALSKSGRPNGTLRIPTITAETIGGLMCFFMLSAAVLGELFDINAYDQPGVEEMKRQMYRILGRRGY